MFFVPNIVGKSMSHRHSFMTQSVSSYTKCSWKKSFSEKRIGITPTYFCEIYRFTFLHGMYVVWLEEWFQVHSICWLNQVLTYFFNDYSLPKFQKSEEDFYIECTALTMSESRVFFFLQNLPVYIILFVNIMPMSDLELKNFVLQLVQNLVLKFRLLGLLSMKGVSWVNLNISK